MKTEEEKMKWAREEAAKAWCCPTTAALEMNPTLAEVFSRILVKHMYEPHMGCATTGELIDEIKARSNLNYRTIDEE